MAVKTVFSAGDGTELECFLDINGCLCIGVYGTGDLGYMGNLTTLQRDDAIELIRILTELEKNL